MIISNLQETHHSWAGGLYLHTQHLPAGLVGDEDLAAAAGVADGEVVVGVAEAAADAVGADAVSVGRHLMPLLQNGADAVAKRIQAMTSELAGVMTATGVHNLGEFDPTVIHRVL